ncbi:hypothetical protein UlMin_009031 [Ulmus minor]
MSTLSVLPVLTPPREDAVQLNRAFNGCDTAAVINILAHRDAAQRALIQQEYKSTYSGDILKRLASKLSGKLKTAVLLWMYDLPTRDATIVKQGLSSDTLNLGAATEVICSRSPSQIQHFKQIYYSRFGAYLEHDIERKTSGDLKKLLLAYVSTQRCEGLEVDTEKTAMDAKALYKAGLKKLGTDENIEKTFIRIFSERSRSHLAVVASDYLYVYGSSIEQAVKKETSGKFKLGLLTIVRCSENLPKYFAKVLHKAMKGLGTSNTTLIRVIVTRTEIDMQYIKGEYLKKYKKPLNDAVHSETSGHYRTFLLSLLGPNH